MATHTDTQITHVLRQYHLCTDDELDALQKRAAHFEQTLFQYIVQHERIDAEQLQNACCAFLSLNKAILATTDHDTLLFFDFPDHIIKNYFILPLSCHNKKYIIAIANPDDIAIAKMISFQTGFAVELQIAKYDELHRLHNLMISEKVYRDCEKRNDLDRQVLIHQLICDAIHRQASDIHFEPYQHYLRVRFRIDGLLHEIFFAHPETSDSIISCIKVLANIDIAIKRLPQDGRLTFRTHLGLVKDCRVNTCPTIHGEKIVIRLLDANTQIKPIEHLGLSKENETVLLKHIQKPQGLILVTGPTGSGKSITLYTLLNLLNEKHRNINTIEDPVEMKIDGINQTHINAKAGITFSQTLRALLRQDPDVMMIGEIRDTETADIAIRAAQTGHLVLSTLHTNSAAEGIIRLQQMGIAPFHLCSALTLIVAQRLVRKKCLLCENGCAHCTQGYHGRVGVFECMPITSEIKTLIMQNKSASDFEKQNKNEGHCTLWESGLHHVKNNVTSLSELYRVVNYHA